MKIIKIKGKISSFAVEDSFSSRYLVKGEPFEDSLIDYYNSENTSVNNFILIPSLQDPTYNFTMNSFKFKDGQTTYSAKGYSLLKDGNISEKKYYHFGPNSIEGSPLNFGYAPTLKLGTSILNKEGIKSGRLKKQDRSIVLYALNREGKILGEQNTSLPRNCSLEIYGRQPTLNNHHMIAFDRFIAWGSSTSTKIIDGEIDRYEPVNSPFPSAGNKPIFFYGYDVDKEFSTSGGFTYGDMGNQGQLGSESFSSGFVIVLRPLISKLTIKPEENGLGEYSRAGGNGVHNGRYYSGEETGDAGNGTEGETKNFSSGEDLSAESATKIGEVLSTGKYTNTLSYYFSEDKTLMPTYETDTYPNSGKNPKTDTVSASIGGYLFILGNIPLFPGETFSNISLKSTRLNCCAFDSAGLGSIEEGMCADIQFSLSGNLLGILPGGIFEIGSNNPGVTNIPVNYTQSNSAKFVHRYYNFRGHNVNFGNYGTQPCYNLGVFANYNNDDKISTSPTSSQSLYGTLDAPRVALKIVYE